MRHIDYAFALCRVSLLAVTIGFASAASAQTTQGPPNSGSPSLNESAGDVNPNSPSPGVAAAKDADGQEIVVTAQFRRQNLQNTPLAITALTGEMLKTRGQTNIAQVANQAPSVTLKPQGATFGTSLVGNIRGVGQDDFSAAVEPGVGLYVDDVYYATLTGSILDLLDVDRIEVLRGPQGTLAGKNSIGGAIKIFSKKPTGSNTGDVSVKYGSFNLFDVRANADFALTDSLSARVSGVAKKQQGYVKRLDFGCLYPAGGPATYIDNNGAVAQVNPAGGIPRLTDRSDCLLGRESGQGFVAGRAQLRYQPSADLDINLAADYTMEDRPNSGNVLLDRSLGGHRVSPNWVDRLPGNPRGATDTNPYDAPIPYDIRFVCGPYCNYATYIALPDTSTGPLGAFANTGGVRPGTFYEDRLKYTGWGVSGNVEYQLASDLNLVSITAYRAYKSNWPSDDDLSPLAIQNNKSFLDYWQFTQEVRLNGAALNKTLQYTVGGFYMKQFTNILAGSDLRRITETAFWNNDDTRANTKAAFAQVSWKPVPALTLTGGLRYTDDYKTYVFGRTALGGGPLPASSSVAKLNGVVGTYDGPISTNWDYRANAQYQITPSIMVYGQVSTGFKGGGVNPRPFNAAQALPFGPEKLTTYEIGWKSDLLDRHVRLNIAAFFSKYKDMQLSLSNCVSIVGPTDGFPCNLIVNSGDADVKGFEVETNVHPAQGMTIDGSVSYLDFKYTKFGTFGNASVGGPGNPAGPQFGDYPPYTPRWKWSLGAQYEIPLESAGSLTPRVDASYQSEIYDGVNAPTTLIPGYTLVNARLMWRNASGDLEISGEVTNLFDKYYFLTGWDRSPGGYVIAQPGAPREWSVTISKKFG
jgi:iron complex outermembrane receptor protein